MEVSNWLTPAAIVVAAIIGGFVTWRMAKRKAALELNDRRFKLYETVKSLLINSTGILNTLTASKRSNSSRPLAKLISISMTSFTIILRPLRKNGGRSRLPGCPALTSAGTRSAPSS